MQYVIRLKSCGYENAPDFVKVSSDHIIREFKNTFCVHMFGDTFDKIILKNMKIEKFNGEHLSGSGSHIRDLIVDYIREGDTANPCGGMIGGYQTVCIENSDIHKNMIRLDKLRCSGLS